MTQETQATIVSLRRLNATIWEYVLEPEAYIAYQAGQYLQIHLSEHPHFYSMANAPSQCRNYVLHIRQPKNQDQAPFGALHQRVKLSLPYGTCDLSHLHADKPILFLAAGTGFAPIRSMIYELLQQADTRPLALYWGVASADDLYDQESLILWQQRLPDFRYDYDISHSHQPTLIHRVLAQHPHDLNDWQIIMAGPFALMYLMRDLLLKQAFPRQNLFSDAFDFE